MFSFEPTFSPRIFYSALLVLLLLAAAAPVAPAQQVLVQNGATIEVSSGGTWDLEGSTMDFGPAGATARLDEQSAGRVTGGTLTAIRDLGSPSQADPAGLGAVLSASSTLGETTVTRGHTVQDAANGNTSIERYYDISSAQTNAGLGATLTFGYADAELGGIAEADLELFKSEDGGTTWSQEGASSRDAQANTVTLSGISSFSRWTLGGASSPLPVELIAFSGTQVEASVRLAWRTASETGNAGFRVQRRSGAGATWETVGFVQSSAAGGTTSEPQSYRFEDATLPYAADALTYRLRQVDTDGTETVTEPITVRRETPLELQKTVPNPARRTATLRYAVPNGERMRIALYDVLGRKVRTVAAGAGQGRTETQLDLAGLASGTYFLRLEARGQSVTRSLTVAR